MLDGLCFDVCDIEQMIVAVLASSHESFRVAVDIKAGGTSCLGGLVHVTFVEVCRFAARIAK